ncbi:MAG: hypothetical protein SGI77_25140 [Pirellulaceae bacterium]|nr:hypothetical protein [Pirellulaceae bacterium]
MTSDATPDTPKPETFKVRKGGKDVQVNYEELFESGHNLWLKKKCADATFLLKAGYYDEAIAALNSAIKRDRPDGSIALIAKHLIKVISQNKKA